jgi:serine/threonine protein kinase
MMKLPALDRIHVREEDPKEKFEILESVGVGNFGVVLKARDRVTEDIVAIKQVPLGDTDKEELDSIIKEVEILQMCDHPNVVRFFGTYQSLGVLWIVMEYCEGGSVDNVYDLLRRPLSEPLIAYVCRETLLGLRYLHEHLIIHRDVKGSNILLTKDGQVKLADFGVSAALMHTLSRRNTFIGTALWMAPEVIVEKEYDYRADIWSLGITTIELAEGQPPHFGMHMARAVFAIPHNDPPTLHAKERWSPQMNGFIRRLLTKEKESRPSAATMLMDPFLNPKVIASRVDMATVVEQLLMKRRSMDEAEGSNTDPSTLTIVTRSSSTAGEDDDNAEEGPSMPADEAGSPWIDDHGGPPQPGASPASRRSAVAAAAAAATAGGGAQLGGLLVMLPLLHLEDVPFDALCGGGRTLLNGGLAASSGGATVMGSGGGGGGGSPSTPLNDTTTTSAACGVGAALSGVSAGTPSPPNVVSVGSVAAGLGLRGGGATTPSTSPVGFTGEAPGIAESISKYHHAALPALGPVAFLAAPPVAPTPHHQTKAAAAAALGDPLAETLHLLGHNVDAVASLCVPAFETTTMNTVRDVYLHNHHLPYTRAVTEQESKKLHHMKFLYGTVLKNVYATTAESNRTMK